MTDYYVEWAIDIEGAGSPEDAARRAYNSFMRPGSIAHVFTVYEVDRSTSATGEPILVDLDRGRDANIAGEPISYPLGEDGDPDRFARRDDA